MLASRRPDLTAETLVLNSGKTYHDLFDDETRRWAQKHLDPNSEDVALPGSRAIPAHPETPGVPEIALPHAVSP